MKIEDLVQLLNNRLREFKLSRDYSKMSGDLERMNASDKEILALEDTLYQLNLLVDTSQSAIVREEILSEVITDGSIAVLGEYDITSYATDPKHERKIMNILSKMGVMDTVEKIDYYIRGKYLSSPVTGEMIMSASLAYTVDVRLMMAIMQQDSQFGTVGLAVKTLNPGNVGNDDDGNIRTYGSWQEGVTAVAEWLSRHRGKTVISETLEETVFKSTSTSTSTSSDIIPTATTTPATTTPRYIPRSSDTTPMATSTPIITTSTTTTITNLPTTTTATPTTDTATPDVDASLSTTDTSTQTTTIDTSTDSWQATTNQEITTTTDN